MVELMSEKKIVELKTMMQSITSLKRAPSQHTIFLHLLGTGKTLTVKEISNEVGFTQKATERAVAKLLQKGLIKRAPFRQRSYNCDNKDIVLSILLTVTELKERLDKINY